MTMVIDRTLMMMIMTTVLMSRVVLKKPGRSWLPLLDSQNNCRHKGFPPCPIIIIVIIININVTKDLFSTSSLSQSDLAIARLSWYCTWGGGSQYMYIYYICLET